MNTTQPTTAIDPDVDAASSELLELKPLATNSQHMPTHKVNRFDLTNDYNLMLGVAQQLQGEVNHWHAATVSANEQFRTANAEVNKFIEIVDDNNDEIAAQALELKVLRDRERNHSLPFAVMLTFCAVGFLAGYLTRAVFGA